MGDRVDDRFIDRDQGVFQLFPETAGRIPELVGLEER
jgi:hypothetical protein